MSEDYLMLFHVHVERLKKRELDSLLMLNTKKFSGERVSLVYS